MSNIKTPSNCEALHGTETTEPAIGMETVAWSKDHRKDRSLNKIAFNFRRQN